MQQITDWHRDVAAKVAAAMPLENGKLGRIASGNHLAAQNDEPEPGTGPTSPLYLALVDAADARDERNAVLRAEYVAKLIRHDWEFQFSDDHSVYCRGRDALAELRKIQKDVDRDFTLWNRHAPVAHRVKVPA